MTKKYAVAIFCFAVCIVVTVGTIWSFSLETPIESSETSSSLVDWLYSRIAPNENIPKEVFSQIVRKGAHFTEYFVLGLECVGLVWMIIRAKKDIRRGDSFYLLPVLFGFLVASVDEIIQLYSGRNASFWDVLLDTLGAFVAVLVVRGILLVFAGSRTAK